MEIILTSISGGLCAGLCVFVLLMVIRLLVARSQCWQGNFCVEASSLGLVFRDMTTRDRLLMAVTMLTNRTVTINYGQK